MGKRTQINKGKIIILALILLLPGFLYIAVNRFGSNEYVRLPVFGEKSLSGETKRNWGREYPDTVFHTVKEMVFKDASGKDVLFPAPDTCVLVVHLLYSRDEAFSGLMLDHVDALATPLKGNPIIRFYSMSVDSMATGASLSSFVRGYKNVAEKQWQTQFS